MHLSVRIINTNVKIENKFGNKKSNNSSFVIVILEFSKFRNIGRSTFGRLKFGPPSENCEVMLKFHVALNS